MGFGSRVALIPNSSAVLYSRYRAIHKWSPMSIPSQGPIWNSHCNDKYYDVTKQLYEKIFVFATRIVQSLYCLYSKVQASSHLLWLYSLVCVGPGRKPGILVFSQRGSFSTNASLPCGLYLLLTILDKCLVYIERKHSLCGFLASFWFRPWFKLYFNYFNINIQKGLYTTYPGSDIKPKACTEVISCHPSHSDLEMKRSDQPWTGDQYPVIYGPKR